MKVAICEDDELLAVQYGKLTKEYLQSETCDCSVDVYNSAVEFENSAENYDLVLLDCELPDGNGIELARTLRKHNTRISIIIITAYDKYVFDGYEVNALRFLTKPLDEQKLKKALNAFLYDAGINAHIRIPLKNKQILLVKMADILYIEADGKNTIVRLRDTVLQSSNTVSDFEAEICKYSFFRTHRRFIVNLASIDSVQQNTILLTNGEIVQVSKRILPTFNHKLNEYIRNIF